MTDAPFGRRLLARIIDLALALALAFALIIPVCLVALVVVAVTPIDADSNVLTFVIVATCYLLGYVALEWFLLVQREGQTLGKGLMGLRVVKDQTGESLTPRASFTRLFIFFAPFPALSAGGAYEENATVQAVAYAGLLVLSASIVMAALRRNRRRTLHDLAAGSRVVIAAKRKIDLRKDLKLMVPAKIDMTKQL